jgi:hypothetical protein
MGKIYITLIGFLGWLLCIQEVLAQCPGMEKYEVNYPSSEAGNRGEIRFFLQVADNAPASAELEDLQFNLWNKSKGAYLYNPSKLDAGFHEDEEISFSLNSNVAEFRNVPSGDSYFLVLYSDKCSKIIGPEGGVVVQNSMSR